MEKGILINYNELQEQFEERMVKLNKGVALSSAKVSKWKTFKKEKTLHIIIWIGLLFVLVFSYIPMAGIIVAFKNYKITSGLWGIFTSEWVGLKWFEEFVTGPMFYTVVRNTLAISLLKLVFAFPIPIIFALMINEIRSTGFKRVVQTASYLPHFISWVVVTGLCYTMFSSVNGLINGLLVNNGLIGSEGMDLLTSGEKYWGLAIGTDIWKETGWNAIIFIAAISGIDSTLYEAAQIDGASRLQRIWHVTLPCIKGTIIIMFILALGGLVNGNMEQALLLGNNLNRDYSEIINSYVLDVGLAQFRVDYACAVGLMQSAISVVLVFGANAVSRKFAGASLY